MTSEQVPEERKHDVDEMEATFRALIENAFDVVGVMDRDGEIAFISPSIRYVLGYTPEERLGENALSNIHPDDAEEAKATLANLREKDGAKAYMQVVLKHKDGSWRTVELIAQNMLSHPVIQGIVINYRDITDRMKTQESLRISEARYRKAFAATPDAITINYIDNGRFIEVNPGFERITGYARDEVIGRPVMDLGIWKEPDARARMLELLVKDGAVRDYEADFVTKDGETRSCLVAAETIELAGEPCMLSVTRDVTVQKLAAQELQKAADTLREEHKAVTEKNAALKEVLEHLETDKAAYRSKLCAHVDDVLSPIIERLKAGGGKLPAKDVAQLEDGLKRITGEDINEFENNLAKLTARELDICELIKQGLSTKEMAERLALSPETIHKHRRMIRRKLQLDKKDINLAAFLRSR